MTSTAQRIAFALFALLAVACGTAALINVSAAHAVLGIACVGIAMLIDSESSTL